MLYQELRTQPRLPLSQVVPLPAPLTLYVEPTNACNFSCRCCPIGLSDYKAHGGGQRTLTFDRFMRVREGVRDLGGVKVVQWYMLGEPLVNPLLPDFIEGMAGLAERQIVTTNGTLLTEEKARRLVASGLDYLRVSIYGHDQASHERETRRSFDLRRIAGNLAALRRIRGDGGKPHVYVKMLSTGDQARDGAFKLLFRDVADEVAVERRMNWNGRGEFGGVAPFTTKRACPFPFYTLVVHADLLVSPCCVDWDRRLVVGDLNEQTLRGVWEGEPLRQLRVAHLNRNKGRHTGCDNCTYFQSDSADNIDDLTAEEFLSREFQVA